MSSRLIQSSRAARDALHKKYRTIIEVNPALSRALVSYQSNRRRPFYRWFKYKEGFSAALVEYILGHLALSEGALLDPFAGVGASILAGRDWGLSGVGIELLPLGCKVFDARLAAERVDIRKFNAAIRRFFDGEWKIAPNSKYALQHLRITRDAFSAQTEIEINQFRSWLGRVRFDANVRALLELAYLSVLETVSFTRKDGQYLRWDERSARSLRGKPFNKGEIPGFQAAMLRQLKMMADDLADVDLFARTKENNRPEGWMIAGSSLDALPTFGAETFDVVFTSPPYCNRYDYTRTYALELACLGIDEDGLRNLRQSLLSCTVENKSKYEQLEMQYRQSSHPRLFSSAHEAFANQDALQEVLAALDEQGKLGELNNSNVPRMVRNYFFESAITIFEMARVLRPGGHMVMVNDNVQYGGEEVPVDLILSDIARQAGLIPQHIWMLGTGKGNSSQQMGVHGRNELRKCAYVWRRA